MRLIHILLPLVDWMKQLYAVATAKDNSSNENHSISLRNEQQQQPQQIPNALDFSGGKPPTPILDTINYPIHMKNLSAKVTCLINNPRPMGPTLNSAPSVNLPQALLAVGVL